MPNCEDQRREMKVLRFQRLVVPVSGSCQLRVNRAVKGEVMITARRRAQVFRCGR